MPAPGRARLRIYDVGGRLVRTLVDEWVGSGGHAAGWDGRDAAGRPVPAATYFLELEASRDTETSRVLLLR
jgi:flagellar hook assembly protein FlgD